MRPSCFFPLVAMSVVWIGTGGCAPKGPVKYQVTGVVRVNGEPAERMVVQLEAVNASQPGNLAYPTGLTDRDGTFWISTEGNRDGAAAGEYSVVFSWLSSPELDAFDMLGGALANAKNTPYRITIPTEGPITFDLKVPEKSIRRPKSGS